MFLREEQQQGAGLPLTEAFIPLYLPCMYNTVCGGAGWEEEEEEGV